MRRLIMLLFTITALVLFPGSSPWEGAASVAPAGELPSAGFFVATNSFPRNTVVDITNIETGKSTRAIVAKTLNSPGLLAIVSNEAAQLIGMRPGSVSRIRMVQPTDPIAYLRFTESVNSGAPSFDSGNVITEDALVAEVYREDTYMPEIVQAQEPAPPPPAQPSTSSGITGPGYHMEPEWGGSEKLNIVDLPGYEVERSGTFVVIDKPPSQKETEPAFPRFNTENEDPVYSEPVYAAESTKEIIKDVSPRYEERAPVAIVKDVPDFWAETESNGVEKEANIFLAEQPKKEVIKEPFAYVTEQPRDEVIKEIFDREEYIAEEPKEVWETVEEIREPEERYQYNLVQTDEQPPPRTVYGIDPSDIIPGIAVATPERQTPAQTRAVPAYTPPAPVITQTPPAPAETRFSVRTISHLDRGQYYVQIAALPAETVENAVRQIDQRFNPVILLDRDNWYRIVIGPLNQGESAAVLARFKSIGYTDAFVRRGN